MHRRPDPRSTACAMVALGFSSALVLGQVGSAHATCTIRRITATTDLPLVLGNRAPAISADGRWIAFASGFDLVGDNADLNQEIFLYNVETGAITQITDTAVSIDANRNPAINASGTRIAFSSDRDITGLNPDANRELFLYEVSTNTFTQITVTTGGFPDTNNLPSINALGTMVAFISDRDLTGDNADFSFEVFLYDTTTMLFRQVTDTVGGLSTDPSIDAGGLRLALTSNGDFTGENADANGEVFLFDIVTGLFDQLSNAAGGGSFSGSASISHNGSAVAFVSNGDPIGENPDTNSEIFLFSRVTGLLRQITQTPGGVMGFIHDHPSIDGTSSRIAFERAELPGFFAVFLFDARSDTIREIAPEPSTSPSISGDGTRIAFEASSDPTGGNPDGNQEIFLAECPRPAAVPALSQFGLYLAALLLLASGFVSFRRRAVR